jgi:hypothetical protein
MKKGTSTVFGILIFVGILFSTIVPLQLYIKEHKILLISVENEMDVNDDYRDLEDLYVFAYPVSDTSDEILVRVKNKGAIEVNVNNIWIKDGKEIIGTGLITGEEEIFGPFTVVLEENTTYPVKVSTRRGRLFSSDLGNLAYGEGTWVIQGLGISVQIANEIGKYYIKVSNSTWNSTYKTLGQDQDDLLVFFEVYTNGNYQVICRKNSASGPDLPGTPMIVEILYPGGPPVVFIYTSGIDV